MNESEQEIDYLMSMTESGVTTHNGGDAELNNVLEWLDTPRGSIYGRPDWGNELSQFKHEPTHSDAVAMNIEFNIIQTLPRDLPNVVLTSIFCEPSTEFMDIYKIRLGLPSGNIEKNLN